MGQLKRLIDETGRIYGRWTVISRAPNQRTSAAWNCVCSCGTERVVRGEWLRQGASQSCGCLNLEMCTTHGHTKKEPTTLYKLWCNMRNRCAGDPNLKRYRAYSGRGITVCERWRDSFESFRDDILKYLGPHPGKGYSLDRYPNNNGNYEPGNVRWATSDQQRQNQRKRKGQSQCIEARNLEKAA